ncbi:MAG: hypothetical protein BGP04_24045 [Rhizobiales bacterium 62-17]|nr:lipocalin family protein [Hyphomicrobiales bacterium]OJY00612.1 MAG: hypothetical protein BGP04_24045 [Rhizobiales bacterium 62-17]
MQPERSVTAVGHVDLKRYGGDWFEICRLPLKWEDERATDITATYSLAENGKIRVDNRCLNNEGKPVQSVGEAEPVDTTNAILTVSFLPELLRWIPFTKGDYWILKLAGDYSVALVGTPDRAHLWLLARQPRLDVEIERDYLEEAIAQGFDLSELIHPVQSGRKVEDVSFK